MSTSLSHVVTNPEQPISPEVSKVFRERDSTTLERLKRPNTFLSEKSKLNVKLANRKVELAQSALKPLSLNVASILEGYDQANLIHQTAVADLGQKILTNPVPISLGSSTVNPVPKPGVALFWWAETWAYDTLDGFPFSFESDGLHFHAADIQVPPFGERFESFGLVSRFAISAERRPKSPPRFWASTPFVEFDGSFVAVAAADSIFDHGVASCELYLRQTMYQIVLGPRWEILTVGGMTQDILPWSEYSGWRGVQAVDGAMLVSQLPANEKIWA